MRERLRNPPLAAAAVVALVVAACGDDPTGADHSEPEGVELVMNGAIVASYEGSSARWTGELSVNQGEETPHISVHFIDDHGDRIVFSSSYYLNVEVANESIAEFEQDTPGEFGGHLRGVARGTTGVVFRLMHGSIGSGHADFVTGPLVARVN